MFQKSTELFKFILFNIVFCRILLKHFFLDLNIQHTNKTLPLFPVLLFVPFIQLRLNLKFRLQT